MDETERANVFKLKSFDEMRKRESEMEKQQHKGPSQEVNQPSFTPLVDMLLNKLNLGIYLCSLVYSYICNISRMPINQLCIDLIPTTISLFLFYI